MKKNDFIKNKPFEKLVRGITELEKAFNDGWIYVAEIEDGVYVVHNLALEFEFANRQNEKVSSHFSPDKQR